MNNLKANPVGFDMAIEKLQKKLHSKLTTLWGVELDGYPRCYSQSVEGKKGIVYYKSNKEYSKSLIHKERNKFFFLMDSEYKKISDYSYSSKAELFFIVNLKECKPQVTSRADEEVRVDVLNILNSFSDLALDIRISYNVADVFRGFENTDTLDLHPYHCFKITFTINDFNIFQKPC